MKTKKIATNVLTAIAGLMVIMSGVMKLTRSAEVVETLTKVGVIDYLNILAAMEIGFAILFFIPKTMKIGFLLLTCYFAGAMATELSHNGPLMNAAIPLILVWVAMFLRDHTAFLPAPALSNA